MYYYFQGALASGQIVSDSVEADNADELRSRLVKQGMQVIDIKLDVKKTLQLSLRRSQLKRGVLIEFLAHLRGLLELGLNITSAVSTVKESIDDQLLKEVLEKVEALIDKGYSLSQAMQETNAFPRLALASIAAAERSNRLEQVFGELADHYKNIEDLAGQAKKAATYPLIALMVLTVVLLMLLLMVVPQLKDVLPGEPPLPTKILIALSDSAGFTWWIPFVLPVGLWALYRRMNIHQRARLWEKLYRVPVMGRAVLNLELSTVFMNLAMLNGGGIPLLETLRLATAGTASAAIRERLNTCYELARQGGSLSEGFRDPLFPPVVVRAISHGEATGRFDQQFAGIAAFLRERTASQLSFLSTFIEPAIILVGGGMLMLMAAGIFAPIYGQLDSIGH